MFTVQDFISKYENYTDDELMNIYSNIAGYSPEAHDALNHVINERGGQDAFLNRLQEKRKAQNEVDRIREETRASFLPLSISFPLLLL